MGPSSVRKSLIPFVAFIALTLTPISTYAQHGGNGGSHGGGGGGFHGGGGGFHGGGGGGFHGGGSGGFHGGGGFYRGGGESRNGVAHGPRSYGGGSYGGERSYSRGGGSESGRNPGSSAARSSARDSSNIRPAINDGQWHSFGNSINSARSSEGRNSAGSENSRFVAHSTGISDSGWRSFGPTRGASGLVGRSSRGTPGFGWRGNGWRGDWHRDWDRGWGWGGWGFAFGWPYWGGYWSPYWAFGWDPWWYGPYWYAPGPVYNYYPEYGYYSDYNYDWSDNPPPYRPDSSPNSSDGAPASSGSTPSPNSDDKRLDLNADTIPLT